jgi:hypothetical protein
MTHRTAMAAVLCMSLCDVIACRPPADGELSAEQMSAVVTQEQDKLQSCYQDGLDRTPYEHEFRLQAQLRIRPNGSVAEVELDQPGLSGLGSCIEQTIRGWQFPTAKNETRASLPLVFHPKVVKSLPPNVQLPPGFKVVQPPGE